MMFLFLQFIDAMSRKIKKSYENLLTAQRRLDHLQRIVKRTCWSD